MFNILHIFYNIGMITLLRTGKILVMDQDSFMRGRDVVHKARDVVEVERNCTSTTDTDPMITLRRN